MDNSRTTYPQSPNSLVLHSDLESDLQDVSVLRNGWKESLMPQKADSTLDPPDPVKGPQCLRGGAQVLCDPL